MEFSVEGRQLESGQQGYFLRLGEITAVMLQSRAHRMNQIASLAIWIEPALLLDQIAVVYDGRGVPLAYIAWAMVTPPVLRRLQSDPLALLHISEWNEGESLWIMDFGCRQGYARDVAGLFRRSLFGRFNAVFYRRGARGLRTFRNAPAKS